MATSASIHSELPTQMWTAQMVAACNFDSNQLDQLAGRIAPLIARQVNSLDGKSDGQSEVSQPAESHEQQKAVQVAAFFNATQMVDQMIVSHHVSHEGMMAAIKLLQQSGQVDRAYELQGRVAAAVNRRELTPAEAGLILPRSMSDQPH